MPPHRRPQAASRFARGAPSTGSRAPAVLRRAGMAVLLGAAALLGAPKAEAATAQRPAAARPAPAKATPARAVPSRAPYAARPAARHQATRHASRRGARGADTAAFDDRAHDDRAHDDPAQDYRTRGAHPVAPAALPAPVLAATSPRAACLAAARQAERSHGLPEGLMVAVALSESGLHAHALNIRGRAHFPEDRATARALLASAGGRGFAGCVQISLGHARGSDWPLDPVQATDWAGALMARAYAETGSWTAAVARFHGGSPRGSQRVICRVRAKLEAAAPGSSVLREASCGGDSARERRNGATLLEIAEAR